MRESKSVLAEIIDCLLLVVVLTAGLFIFMRLFHRALDAIFAALAVSAVILNFLRGRDRRAKAKTLRSKESKRAFDFLTYAGAEQRLDYFSLALSRFDNFEKSGDCLVSGNRRVYPVFIPAAALPSRLCEIHDECVAQNAKGVVILPAPPDPVSKAFIDGSDRVTALFGDKLCDLLQDSPLSLPEKKSVRKGKFKRLISAALSRELFRRYLFSGALLIGTSYILPTSPLYIAAGALCLTLALATLLPKRKKA